MADDLLTRSRTENAIELVGIQRLTDELRHVRAARFCACSRRVECQPWHLLRIVSLYTQAI